MFVGEYEYKVDNKGRLPLPTKFRKEIGEGLVLTVIADECITAYTKKDWDTMTASQAPTSFFISEKERKLNRFIYSNANEVTIDNQGRISLPNNLRSRCGINDSIVIAGVNNYFEIWNMDNYKNQKPTADDAKQFVETLGDKR
jgi:MraZ protein